MAVLAALTGESATESMDGDAEGSESSDPERYPTTQP